ncbi:hypothetical protein AB0L75_27985 [Streptomyces sp. NPDC052101]|uniref:hypothetical protein n=1 Tax=Streptomyces sp. NPDC052101 TaxID=3155763 RepID=UPI003439AC04
MFRRNRAERAFREARRVGQAMLAMHTEWPFDEPCPAAAEAAPAPEATGVPDFLPPEFRAPSRQDVAGFMMRWDPPLVIDGQVRECPECGAYRNWIVFNMRDDSIWLRCPADHEIHETGLDTAWYNRHSGPIDRVYPTLDDGLRHLGH